MDYWDSTMQDDVYLISVDGWQAQTYQLQGKTKGWTCDLVPKNLVIARYFEKEQQNPLMQRFCRSFSKERFGDTFPKGILVPVIGFPRRVAMDT
jgi:hypothetical protein